MGLNGALALANAGLTAASVSCMLLALRAVRRKQVERHRNLMLAAASASFLFLVLFVFRYVRFGPTPFRGRGPWRWLFDAVLFSHEPLAVVNVPLVGFALAFGLLRRDDLHREFAAVAFPVWLYVSATGLLIYVLLYVFPAI